MYFEVEYYKFLEVIEDLERQLDDSQEHVAKLTERIEFYESILEGNGIDWEDYM